MVQNGGGVWIYSQTNKEKHDYLRLKVFAIFGSRFEPYVSKYWYSSQHDKSYRQPERHMNRLTKQVMVLMSSFVNQIMWLAI